jgi:hypothetical protein
MTSYRSFTEKSSWPDFTHVAATTGKRCRDHNIREMQIRGIVGSTIYAAVLSTSKI